MIRGRLAMKTLNLKKKSFIGRKEAIVVVAAIILTTAGIKASDQLLDRNGNEAALGENGCPQDMARVSSEIGFFCIDRYEASAGKDCPAADPRNQEESRTNLDAPKCKAASLAGARPWRNLSQNQAALACAKAGKRLPTNREWLAASLGTPDKSAGWEASDCQVAKNWEEQPGPAGSGENCISGAGAYDMIGNVWEWVQGTVSDGSYEGRSLPKKGYVKGVDGDGLPSETGQDQPDPNYHDDYMWLVDVGTRAFARGGYWDNKSDAGQYSIYLESPPSYATAGIGFRCVK